MYNINRSGENIASVEEYNIGWNGSSAVNPVLVGTMYYSFDSNGKQFRKKYVPADGSQEQKYVFEFKDEQNVAVQLPTGAVSHAKSDHFGRKVFDEIQLGKGFLNRTFTYHKGVVSEKHEENDKRISEPTTTLVKEIKFADGRTIAYEYDNEERITKVIDSVDGTTEYTYDALGQLLTETKEEIVVNTMTYDLYGNITEKNGVTYTYGNGTWKDLLTSVGNQPISYDANGNPTSYRSHSLTWEKGRQLKQFGNYSYKYNNDGIRIEKTENCKTHKYILDGTNILKEIVEDSCCNCTGYTNEYLYDLDGTVCGIKHNGTAYYFYKNLQGDVIAITDETGAVVARYSYDAWGKCTVESDASGVDIANINPFRYRSYYYDSEIGMYYLQSRYYDPEVGRFINADNATLVTMSMLPNGYGLFTYCCNNPIYNIDLAGFLAFSMAVIVSAAVVGAVFSAISQIALNFLSGRRGSSIFKGVALCFVPGAQAIGVGLIVAGASSMASNITSAAGVDGKTAALISNGLNIVAGAILLATPFAAIGASMIGAGIGGFAGGFISEHFGGSFELGSAIGNIVGGFAGGQIYKGLTTTKLFRAVSSAEAASISKTGVFSEGAGQMEGKFFATSRANATTWGTKLGSDKIVSVRVLRSGLSHESVTFFYRLDGIGKAYYFSDLSFLNSIVKNIRF